MRRQAANGSFNLDRLKLSGNLAHLSRNGRHVLIQKSTGRWVMLDGEAYEIITRCEGMAFEDATRVAQRTYGWGPEPFESLFQLLIDKGILVLGEGTLAGDKQNLPESIRPKVASFSLTNRCNLKCMMCFANATVSPAEGELSSADVEDILTKLSEGGCTTLSATGGEPLLREDLLEILHFARKRFQRIVLQTNGTLIDRAKARRLSNLVDQVRVALDGSMAGIHDAIRGEGSFDRALQGIRWLREADVDTLIDCTLTRLSAQDTGNMKSLASSLGATLSIGCYRAMGRGAQAKDRLLIPYEELAMPKKCGDGSEDEEPSGDRKEGRALLPDSLLRRVSNRCSAITGRISISPHGKVYPCEFLRGPEFAIGNLLKAESLSKVLVRDNPAVQTVISRTVEMVPGCKDCEVRYFCNGLCMAEAYWTKGSIWDSNPYCVVKKTQLRKQLWEEI